MDQGTPVPIEGFANYVVTSDGRVFNTNTGHELARWPDPHGYLWVSLSRLGSQKRHARAIHLLVVTSFHGPKPDPDHVCRHLNGNRTDNRAENLAWGTRVENAADAERHGTAVWLRQGPDRIGLKITDDEARELVLRAEHGESATELAREYGISRRYVYDLKARKHRAYMWQATA